MQTFIMIADVWLAGLAVLVELAARAPELPWHD